MKSERRCRAADPSKIGTVVGYGFLQWPESAKFQINGDVEPVLVYLVQLSEGGFPSIERACVVFRIDQVMEVKE